MPTVPTYQDQSTLPNVSSAAFSAPADIATNVHEQQNAALAQSLGALGSSAHAIAMDQMNEANQVKLAEARNKAMQAQQDLIYGTSAQDPNALYNQRGADALTRDSGMPLSEEFTAKYKQTLGDIAGTLGNNNQKRQFAVEQQQLLANFHGVASQHQMAEYDKYRSSVWDGQLQLGYSGAVKGYADPLQVGANLSIVQRAAFEKAKIQGGDPIAAQRDATSKVWEGVVRQSLENGDTTHAVETFNMHREKDMNANDVLSVQGAVNHVADSTASMDAVRATVGMHASSFAPTNQDLLTNAVLQTESKGKDFGSDGKPTTSAVGAKYGMQVMPATAANPGYGIKPAQEDTPAEYNRVGQEKLAVLVKKYPQMDYAVAAYNAGEGNVDKAIEAAQKEGKPGNWLAHLPAETQAYVPKVMSSYFSGGAAPQLPTKNEFVQNALAQLGDNPRIERIAMTRELAEKQYNDMQASRTEQGENARRAAQQALISNGGNWAAVSPDIKVNLTRYAPEEWNKMPAYAAAIQQPREATYMPALNEALANPQKLAAMSDADFAHFQNENFSIKDQHTIAKLRADILNPNGSQGPDSIDHTALTKTVNNRLNSIGINPTPKTNDNVAQQRVGAINSVILNGLIEQQKQVGHKLTEPEIIKYVDSQFSKNAYISSNIMGWNQGTKAHNLLNMTVGDLPTNGDLSAKSIRQKLTSGGYGTTDSDVMKYYWEQHNTGGK